MRRKYRGEYFDIIGQRNIWMRIANNEVICVFVINDFTKHIIALNDEKLRDIYCITDNSNATK